MNNKNVAPIVLFTYDRYTHLTLTINSLKENRLAKFSKLFIFSDGPKSNREFEKIKKIRSYLKEISGFKKIIIIERKKNYGLSKNIIDGVSFVLKKFKKIIVVEDDLIVNKFFLDYMNSGLNIYKRDKNVASIHGYIYPIKDLKKKIKNNTFFLKGADCWGWATWSRAWNTFEKDGKKLSSKLIKENKIKEFNFNDYYNYYQMLKDQIDKKNDSWAIRWYASCFLKKMYTLYPSETFVQNIGIDRYGQNTKIDLLGLSSKKIEISDYKIKKNEIKESQNARELVENFYKSKKIFRIKAILKKFLNV